MPSAAEGVDGQSADSQLSNRLDLRGLHQIFRDFCSFGAGHAVPGETSTAPMMDGARFAKFAKDSHLLDEELTTVDVDLIFVRTKSKNRRKISYDEFENALVAISKKKCPRLRTREDLLSAILPRVLEVGGPVVGGKPQSRYARKDSDTSNKEEDLLDRLSTPKGDRHDKARQRDRKYSLEVTPVSSPAPQAKPLSKDEAMVVDRLHAPPPSARRKSLTPPKDPQPQNAFKSAPADVAERLYSTSTASRRASLSTDTPSTPDFAEREKKVLNASQREELFSRLTERPVSRGGRERAMDDSDILSEMRLKKKPMSKEERIAMLDRLAVPRKPTGPLEKSPRPGSVGVFGMLDADIVEPANKKLTKERQHELLERMTQSALSKKQKLERLRREADEEDKHTLEINKRSKAMKRDGPVGERLFELSKAHKDKEKEDSPFATEASEAEATKFHPKINKRSAMMKREGNVGARLYGIAKNRMETEEICRKKEGRGSAKEAERQRTLDAGLTPIITRRAAALKREGNIGDRLYQLAMKPKKWEEKAFEISQRQVKRQAKLRMTKLDGTKMSRSNRAARTIQSAWLGMRRRQRWRALASDVLGAKEMRGLRHRNRVREEIVSSERVFLQQLKKLHDDFLIPLCHIPKAGALKPILSDPDVKAVFANVTQLVEFHRVFLSELESSMANFPVVHFGKFFIQILPFFKVYTEYINNYDGAIATLYKCRKKNKHVRKFLQEKEEGMNLTIESLLICPVQRIPRYKLLFEDLVKHSPKEHFEYEMLCDVSEGLGHMAGYVNESVKRFEMSMKMIVLNDAFGREMTDRTGEKLLEPHRYLVADAVLMEVTKKRLRKRSFSGAQLRSAEATQLLESGRRKPRRGFLFNDILVVCKDSDLSISEENTPIDNGGNFTSGVLEELAGFAESLSFKWIVRLSSATVDELPELPIQYAAAFVVTDEPSGEHLLLAPSNEVKQEWVSCMNMSTVDLLVNARTLQTDRDSFGSSVSATEEALNPSAHAVIAVDTAQEDGIEL